MAQLTIQQAFDQASQHLRAGRVREAEQLFGQILARQPEHAGAIYYLGLLALQQGRNDAAIELIGNAIALSPKLPEPHNNLGLALQANGRFDEAIASYQTAISLKPNYAAAFFNLGTVLRLKGQLTNAITAYRAAIAHKPDYANAYNDLSVALHDNGQHEEALAACRQVIALQPDCAQAHGNLGNGLRDKGQLDEAIAAYRQAIALEPNQPDVLNNLGSVLEENGQLDEAIAAYRQAIALRPSFADAYSNLGNALNQNQSLDQAIAAYRQSIALDPDLSAAYSNLGSVLVECGQLDEAIAAYRRAIALHPDDARTHSNLLLALQYPPAGEPAAIAEEHRYWNQQHALPLKKLIQAYGNNHDPNRRLRIGYVSPDFRNHSVYRFALPLIAAHDHSQFEVYCYAHVAVPDDATKKVQEHADAWRNIVGLTDAQTADLIRKDQIDILIDLSGHTARNRLLVFAQKPAPVQVTYLGYPATTGLETIDYRLTDALADPPGLADTYCSEKLIRLPRAAWCFAPQDAPPVSALPALQVHRITFGNFNTFAKVNELMLQRWAELLHRVDGSRLLLKGLGLKSHVVQRRVLQLMETQGINADRLILRGWVSAAEHLTSYNQVDIALDTYPYHGTTTTCESLWMGVPVVTLAGQSHVSRVGVSLLSNVGLGELVAQTPEEYVSIAASLANDPERLKSIRSTLRQRLLASPLMDAPAFARDVEAAYRRMWRTWSACARS